MKNRSMLLRCAALLLAILTISLSLVGCKSREVRPDKLGRTVVGTVGEYEVYYDELYFLVKNYKDGLGDEAHMDHDALNDVLWELVEKNIITNYAILSLCKDAEVKYDEKELDSDIQDYIDNFITQSFEGDRDLYLKSLEENGLSDRYVRFTAEVDLLYDLLPTKYSSSGIISSDPNEIYNYIKENFVRTRHIMIANDVGDAKDENRAIALDAAERLSKGETNMYDLIGSKINEDLLIPAGGYCFPAGSMEKEYEKAAFDLEVGEYSGVVESYGENGMGEYLSCFYVIERIEIDNEYINENFNDLSEKYNDAIIYEKLDEKKKSMTFEKNDFSKDLDLTDLEPFGNAIDPLVITIIVASVVGICAIAAVVVIFVKKRRAKTSTALTKK